MPPKRKGAKANAKVSDFCPPTEKALAPQTPSKHTTMVLTKSDLQGMFNDFKGELRKELGSDIKASIDQLRADLTKKLTALQHNVDSVGTRVLDLESHNKDQDKITSDLQEDVLFIKNKLSQAHLKMEDLENRARRGNVRDRDLEEGAEGSDLDAFLVGLFLEVLDPTKLKIKLDRAHRVGILQPG